MNDYRKPEKRRPLISGIVFLGLGLWMLWMDAEWLPPPDQSWPVILVIIGLAIMVSAFFRKSKNAAPPDQPPTI